MEGVLYRSTSDTRNFNGSRDDQESFSLCIDQRAHVKYRKTSNSDSPMPRISVTEIKACDGTCQSKTTLPPEVEKAVTEWFEPANRQRQPGLL